MNNKDQKQSSAQTQPSVDIHDRVAEAYYGLMGPQFMRDTQARIHWICRQVEGKSILDVGCSQGIVPILLAREGLHVIGIDSSPKAIDEANHYLANEPEQVRRHVSFVSTDFLSWDCAGGKIDTVVMSEVLEHLTRPESFLETAARILPKKGRLIVTVPFGINDFIDHKHTFYLLKPLRLLSKHFDLVGIEILGKWLGIVATRRVGIDRRAETVLPTVELVEKLESAFYQIERVLRDETTLTRSKLEEANQKYRGSTEQVSTLKQRVTQEEAARQSAEQALAQATTQLDQTQRYLQEERTALQQQVAQLSQQEHAHSASADEAGKNLVRLKCELDAVRGKLEEANQKYRGATEQVATLQQRVTQEEAARQLAEQGQRQAVAQVEQTARQLEQSQVRLQEERIALQQQVAQSTAEVQAKTITAHEAEKQVVRLEGELGTVRGRLEEANQKYRGSTEQVSTLKQRVTQEEAARQAAEQKLQETARQLEQSQVRLQEERIALQQQVAQSTAEVQAKTITAHEAEKQVVRLEGELGTVRGRLEEANQKYRGSTEQVSTLKQRVTQEEAARQAAEQKLQETARQLEQSQVRLQEERIALQQQVAQSTAEVQAKTITAHEAEKQVVRLEGELGTVRGRLEEANQKYRGSTEQVSTLKQRVTEEETARQTAQQALAQVATQLDQAQRSLQEERTTLQQQLAQLNAEGQAKAVAVQATENKLLRLDAELDTIRSRLEEANQKYRGATEQVSTLKQRVTEEEAARQAAEQKVHQATNQVEQVLRQLEQSQVRLQEERTALQQQIAQLGAQGQAKAVEAQEAKQQMIRLEGELEAAHGRLKEANQKYRGATEQVSTLKQRVTENEMKHGTDERLLEEAKNNLDQARAKYRQVTGTQIPELKNRLKQLERTHQQKIAAEHQLVKARAAISFQLGYLLIHGFKSVDGFLRLPAGLWALRKETVQRRKNKSLAFSPPQLLPPSTEASFTVPQSQSVSLPLVQETHVNRQVYPIEAPVPLNIQPTVGTTPSRKLNIACIMDEFTYSSYQPEAILHQLTPANWKAELEAANPDLLFIESAWRGKDELWTNKVSHTPAELQGIVEWCRSKKVPIVFWCKEDPIHFKTFLNTAKLADYVFTTDIDCIHRYKAALGHDRVYLLPFACQPATTNPIETYARKDAFCFAGSYYVRYPERTRDLGSFVMELPAFRPLEIYDRNYGKDNPNYQFPEEYQPYIVGTLPFDQIDKAYKGYRYAINLNSIKQSQSMFARRVFELLASNTITISNFSRGVRLLFGDLVITSDSGHEIVNRLKKIAGNAEHSRKLRLAALRKVMREHTYGQRLAYIVSKIRGKTVEQSLPCIAVLAHAANHSELDTIQSQYQRQQYANTSLYVVVADGISPPVSGDTRIHFIESEQAKKMVVDGIDKKAELVAGMVAADYYGPNYLEDIALATRYTQAELIGKAARYTWEGGKFELKQPDAAYHPVQSLPARAAAIRRQTIANENVLAWVQALATCQLQADRGFAIDEFNYCEQGAAADSALVRDQIDDLPGLNTGLSIDNLLERAERIAPESVRDDDDCPRLTGKQFAEYFDKSPSRAIALTLDGDGWRVNSTLPDGKHVYLYATVEQSLEELGFTDQLKFYFDVTPGLNIQLVIVFLDAQKQKISHVITQVNCNQEAAIPPGTDWVRFGLRFYAGGDAEVKALLLGHRNFQPAEIIGEANHLLLTNHYPSYDDLYHNAFVHTRVRAYHARGVRCDVFRLRPEMSVSYHEFEDVNVVSGFHEVLHQMLSTGRYKTILVHVLDAGMWEVLRHYIDRVKVIVWIHGAEIQPWHRRDFNHQTDDERMVAKRKSDERMAFWNGLLRQMPVNVKLIFVSNFLAEAVMEDLGFRLPQKHYEVVHNPINTDLFGYHSKPTDQRKKILSIRPYASRTYANDLSVKAILALSGKPYFKDLEFRMIGAGKLFDEVLEPLRGFSNVHIEKRYLTHAEIAALHREYGIFLCPTRMDTQGVSRDEAMASGLVPVTNAVAAIPEFVDDSCGILAPGEDAEAMARGIALLYEHPEQFSAMSEAAAKRVRTQSDVQRVIGAELAVILGDSEQIKYRVLDDAA